MGNFKFLSAWALYTSKLRLSNWVVTNPQHEKPCLCPLKGKGKGNNTIRKIVLLPGLKVFLLASMQLWSPGGLPRSLRTSFLRSACSWFSIMILQTNYDWFLDRMTYGVILSAVCTKVFMVTVPTLWSSLLDNCSAPELLWALQTIFWAYFKWLVL